jgi:hypothetical protein
MPGKSASTTASVTATPGPVSKARTPSICPPGGTMVTLPMPPMFCSARQCEGAEKSSASAIGASGAPCPPAARSATRKSPTVSSPVRSAITAISPICSVECGGSCQIVCPWDPTARISAGASPDFAIASRAASASHPPRSKFTRQ